MEASLVDRRVAKLRDPEALWRRSAEDTSETWARLLFPVPVWVREVRLYAQPAADQVPDGGAPISRAEVRLFVDEDARQMLEHREVAHVDAKGSASFVGAVQEEGVRVVEVRLDAVSGEAAGLVGLAEIEVIARGDAPPEGRITPAIPMIPMEERDDPFSGRIYRPEDVTAAPAVAEESGTDRAFEDCPEGSVGAVRFEAGALPVESTERVQVQLAGMEVGRDGSIRLPSVQSSERPIYRVILEADCGEHACLWNGIALDRDATGQGRVLVSARAGGTPTPDRTWTPKTSAQSAETIPLLPPLYGRYLEVSFTLTAADRNESPALHGFRACYGGI